MSNQNSPRKVVLTLLVGCTIGWLSDVRAQDQAACASKAGSLMAQAPRLLQPFSGGTATEKPDDLAKVYRQFAMGCLERSRCGMGDVELSLIEASLDDDVLTLQRQKLTRFKAVMADVREIRSDACAALLRLEELTTELKALNSQQLSRLDELAATLFANPVGPM